MYGHVEIMKCTYTLLVEHYRLQFVPILNNIASSSGACRQIVRMFIKKGLCKIHNQISPHHLQFQLSSVSK
jgi:hypothetical protein